MSSAEQQVRAALGGPDLWLKDDGNLQGYGAKPGAGPWWSAENIVSRLILPTEGELTVRENVPFEMIPKTDNVDTCFVYAKKGTRLADVFAVRTLLPARVVNWYVYED